jgi:iron complex transport system substrate-binding protein
VRRSPISALVLGVALFTAACGSSVVRGSSGPAGSGSTPARTTSPSFPVTITDDDGMAVTLNSPPARIVTWAPSNTEILFALGLGSKIVGDSGSFDDYPPAAKAIPHVGGEGGVTPDIEKLVALHADLVLNGFEGGQDWKQRLRQLGIPVFSVYATTLDDAVRDIRTVGRLTGATPQAAAVASGMEAKIDAVRGVAAQEPRVSCFFEAYYPPLTTIGPHTFIFDVLRQAGCDPVSVKAKSDYPEWSVDKLVQQAPDVYLAASESAASPGAVGKRPGFSGIAAVAAGRVFLIDSDLITRPGPRVVDALEDIARDLHPAAS